VVVTGLQELDLLAGEAHKVGQQSLDSDRPPAPRALEDDSAVGAKANDNVRDDKALVLVVERHGRRAAREDKFVFLRSRGESTLVRGRGASSVGLVVVALGALGLVGGADRPAPLLLAADAAARLLLLWRRVGVIVLREHLEANNRSRDLLLLIVLGRDTQKSRRLDDLLRGAHDLLGRLGRCPVVRETNDNGHAEQLPDADLPPRLAVVLDRAELLDELPLC
jgi:hypothetical protein